MFMYINLDLRVAVCTKHDICWTTKVDAYITLNIRSWDVIHRFDVQTNKYIESSPAITEYFK